MLGLWFWSGWAQSVVIFKDEDRGGVRHAMGPKTCMDLAGGRLPVCTVLVQESTVAGIGRRATPVGSRRPGSEMSDACDERSCERCWGCRLSPCTVCTATGYATAVATLHTRHRLCGLRLEVELGICWVQYCKYLFQGHYVLRNYSISAPVRLRLGNPLARGTAAMGTARIASNTTPTRHCLWLVRHHSRQIRSLEVGRCWT